jgi:hypothetical protein
MQISLVRKWSKQEINDKGFLLSSKLPFIHCLPSLFVEFFKFTKRKIKKNQCVHKTLLPIIYQCSIKT